MVRTHQSRGETGAEYTVRRYESGDEEGFLALFNEVWTAEKTMAWFDWRYRDNPYAEEVTMFVAEYGGRVVATRPFVPVRVAAGDETRLAFLCTDVMTDAAHRRRGLFEALSVAALEHYAARPVDERPAFLFDHSNRYSRPGTEKLGWEYRDAQVRHVRLQRAGSYVEDRVDGLLGRTGGVVATAFNRAFLRARDRRADFDADRFAVERRDDVPVETLAGVYEACRPDAVHVVYDEAFYEWRFAEPGNAPAAVYVVRWEGHPVAGVVAHSDHDERNDTTMVTVSHVTPAAGGPERTDAVAAAFERLLADFRDADVVRTANPLVPHAVLDAYSFFPDDRLPMSKLAERSGLTLGYRPVVPGERAPFDRVDDDAAWSVGGRPVRSADPYLWSLA